MTATDGRLAASGDLYEHAPPVDDGSDPDGRWTWPWRELFPSEGIPAFPRAAYRFYMRVISLQGISADLFRLRFELHEYLSDDQRWENRGYFTARLRRSRAPVDYPSRDDFLTGEVRDSSGATAGFLTLGWVSEMVRRATVEIDRVPDAEFPLNNGGAVDWQTVFGRVGWEALVVKGDGIVAEPSGDSWSGAELHATMLEWREALTNLDFEWRYHLLCVRRIDITERGWMFDTTASDSNKVPREAAAIASHWVIPDEPPWGKVRGQRFGSADAPYFRTAVHELGHAFNLVHPSSSRPGTHIMQNTESIARQAQAPVEFPDNIDWAFSPVDTLWMRHAPDPYLRPGGSFPFGHFGAGPSLELLEDRPSRRAEGLTLEVVAWLDEVPLGAPVRVHAVLTNTGTKAVSAPAVLSFKTGAVSGRVTDPAGRVRDFRSLVICVDSQQLIQLPPGERVEQSFTLLRGAQGSLFPSQGEYKVAVTVEWEDGEGRRICEGACLVIVTDVRDANHAVAARKLLNTPDALLTLVLAGDHLPEGREALQAGLDNEVLRPHFAAVEARRLAQRFRDRPADLVGARQVLDESAVLTPSEIRGLSLLTQAAPNASNDLKSLMLTGLRSHAAKVKAGRDLLRPLESM